MYETLNVQRDGPWKVPDICESPLMHHGVTLESYPYHRCVWMNCLQRMPPDFSKRMELTIGITSNCFVAKAHGQNLLGELCDIHSSASDAVMSIEETTSDDIDKALESIAEVPDELGDLREDNECEMMLKDSLAMPAEQLADWMEREVPPLSSAEDREVPALSFAEEPEEPPLSQEWEAEDLKPSTTPKPLDTNQSIVSLTKSMDNRQSSTSSRALDPTTTAEPMYANHTITTTINRPGFLRRAAGVVCKRVNEGVPPWMKLLWRVATQPVLIYMALSVLRCRSMPLSCAQSVVGFGLMSPASMLKLLKKMGFEEADDVIVGYGVTAVARKALEAIQKDLQKKAMSKLKKTPFGRVVMRIVNAHHKLAGRLVNSELMHEDNKEVEKVFFPQIQMLLGSVVKIVKVTIGVPVNIVKGVMNFNPCSLAYKFLLQPLASRQFWTKVATDTVTKSCKSSLFVGSTLSLAKSLKYPLLGYTIVRHVCGPPQKHGVSFGQ
eukprot:gnl/MRDRNA2_/MRDRNA2_207631_c0_seq1.p1 gnl/MRDRNA2_/MRDRNA2_207631_c0~~gnl/MRDRNA2_/MRDRNA2_207631_c0_seq1.p1  ORF type:complete len:521 (-),score=87.39 gnl/MRDRNA2_/MRDRNA2_207631_c0_seq1:109-1590(-)